MVAHDRTLICGSTQFDVPLIGPIRRTEMICRLAPRRLGYLSRGYHGIIRPRLSQQHVADMDAVFDESHPPKGFLPPFIPADHDFCSLQIQ